MRPTSPTPSTRRLSHARLAALVATPALALATAGHAQTVPDAGRVLQQLGPAEPPQPRQSPSLDLTTRAQPSGPVAPGVTVELRDVTFVGNTVFDSATLHAVVGDVSGHRFDLPALRALTDKVAEYYRHHGYPFTRVLLPEQDLASGVLQIRVLEGRYGRVVPGGDARLSRGVGPFLSVLKRGELIEATRLERAMLIIDDQPGVKVRPTIAPGATTGAGDLTAELRRTAWFGGDVGYDNAGSQYVGVSRGRLDLYAFSPFTFGDQITLRAMRSDLGMWLGSADYDLPIGGSGLRAGAGYARTSYALGSSFAALKASGVAQVVTVRTSYPLIRSQITNVSVSADAVYKVLDDDFAAVGVSDHKTSVTVPVAVQFDRRDAIGGGGVTFGMAAVTGGRLNLQGAQAVVDFLTARTAGDFAKAEVDVTRIQRLPGRFSLRARFAGQWASRNLDSSEKLVLGGPAGIRAVSVDDGLVDQGWLLQTELHYQLGPVSPYLLYDIGGGRANKTPWDAASAQSATLGGGGLGARVGWKRWTLDTSVSWRQSQPHALISQPSRSPRFWANLSYRF